MQQPAILDIGYLLISANRLLGARVAAPLRELGLTPPQSLLILAVSEQEEGVITPGQIGAFIGADSPTVSGIIGRLERSGHIRTDRNPADGRSRIVMLTPKAEALVPAIHQTVMDASSWAQSLMNSDDFEQLKSLLLQFVTLAERSEGDC